MITESNNDKLTLVSKFNKLSNQRFDSSLAQKLAGLIRQSYKQFNESEIGNLDNWKLEDNYEFKPLNIETQRRNKKEITPFGFVAYETSGNTKNIYIVFRGTRKFVEWFKDANIQLVSYKNGEGRNHERVDIKDPIVDNVVATNQSAKIITQNDFGCVTAGFRGIYISLREQLLEALNNLPNDSRVFVTGHSLGGALATLAVPDILNNTHFKTYQSIVLYTFASPRCGDRTFAESFKNTNVQHWRIANTEDIVTTMPFPTGNVFEPAPPETSPEHDKLLVKLPRSKNENEIVVDDLGIGGVTGVDKNPNPLFGFLKAMYDRNKRRMPDYAHTGTPIYFTIHKSALERHHNLEEVYMLGIGQNPL